MHIEITYTEGHVLYDYEHNNKCGRVLTKNTGYRPPMINITKEEADALIIKVTELIGEDDPLNHQEEIKKLLVDNGYDINNPGYKIINHE